MLHLKHLEKQEQAEPKTSRRNEIIKIRVKINEIESKENHTKTLPFYRLSYCNLFALLCKNNLF
jgi:hypothetical protein